MKSMISAQSSVVVATEPEPLWDRLVDVRQWGNWFPQHAGWPDGAPSELVLGRPFRQRLACAGFSDCVTATITTMMRPELLVMSGRGNYGADARTAIRLDRLNGGETRVVVRIEIVGMLARPLSLVAKAGLQRNLRRSLCDMAIQLN